jgi:hypothetical protein
LRRMWTASCLPNHSPPPQLPERHRAGAGPVQELFRGERLRDLEGQRHGDRAQPRGGHREQKRQEHADSLLG